MGGVITKAKEAVLWSAVEKFSVQGVQFILNIVIARLLVPEDYGLIAMSGIFIAIAQVFVDSGFSNALIQKKDRSELDFSTVFYFSILASLIIYLILYLISDYISLFYMKPELSMVIKVLALSIPISSLAVVQRAKLTIQLNFRALAKVSLVAVSCSGAIGIFLANRGFGVWALVAQVLMNVICSSTLFWLLSRWKPQYKFSLVAFTTLFSFGSKLLTTGIIHVVYSNLYTIVIGRKFSSSDLGYYNRAFSFSNIMSETLTNIFYRVTYPLQCEYQDNEEELLRIFVNNLRMSIYVLLPFMVCLCILSEPLINYILKEHWLPAAKLLALLSIAHVWRPLISVNETILTVKGRADLYLKLEFVSKAAGILVLFATIPFGLYLMCAGLIISSLFNFLLSIHYAKKVIAAGFRVQFSNLLPIFSVCILCGIVTFLSVSIINDSFCKLFIGGFTCFSSYVLLSFLFKIREIHSLRSAIFKA